MKAQDLLAKAIRAATSAKMLLDAGDADAAWVVSQAQMFVDAMQNTFLPKSLTQ